jgi:hypothetical protein
MRIGLIDVDGHNFPNLALMKLSAYHKAKGDEVEWYTIFGDHYDVVYMAKVFTHTEDYNQVIPNADKIIKGGTGYDVNSRLPEEAEKIVPDYSIYPFVDDKTAYGFLTRGCIRKCPWCVVPRKEGNIHPYQDVDEIAVDGRTNLILMDNNILAAGDYGIQQLEKIAAKGYKVDFNQAMDARLVTDDIAKVLARIKWKDGRIRFACDTKAQIKECEKVIDMLTKHGFSGDFFMYTILIGDIDECYKRTHYWWKRNKQERAADPRRLRCITIAAQPYLDAMATLCKMEDMFCYDSAKTIVLYFLSNAGTWRGETAKRIKAELKAMAK